MFQDGRHDGFDWVRRRMYIEIDAKFAVGEFAPCDAGLDEMEAHVIGNMAPSIDTFRLTAATPVSRHSKCSQLTSVIVFSVYFQTSRAFKQPFSLAKYCTTRRPRQYALRTRRKSIFDEVVKNETGPLTKYVVAVTRGMREIEDARKDEYWYRLADGIEGDGENEGRYSTGMKRFAWRMSEDGRRWTYCQLRQRSRGNSA